MYMKEKIVNVQKGVGSKFFAMMPGDGILCEVSSKIALSICVI